MSRVGQVNGAKLAALLLLAACSAEVEQVPSGGAPGPVHVGTMNTEAGAATEEELLLGALGYAEWGAPEPAAARAASGVLLHAEAAGRGANLFKSGPRHRALLMDMEGLVLHSWEQAETSGRSWHHIELGPEGELYALVKTRCVEKLDADSRVIWRAELKAHHDLAVDASGGVLVLTESVRTLELEDGPCPIVDNGVARISPTGELLGEQLLSSLFADRIPAQRIAEIREHTDGRPERIHRKAELLDVFHANSIEVLGRDVPGLGRAGDWLVSLRNLDLVAVVDPERWRVVWSFGPGTLDRQHQPSLLANGNLLVFDNGASRGWSRVIEVEPASGEIVWEYRGTPEQSFFTDTRGSCQQLPDGNLLIVDSNSGRAFEVDRAGAIVWEFLNPDFDAEKSRRATIYRMARIEPELARAVTGAKTQ